jgi:hypothetical protein
VSQHISAWSYQPDLSQYPVFDAQQQPLLSESIATHGVPTAAAAEHHVYRYLNDFNNFNGFTDVNNFIGVNDINGVDNYNGENDFSGLNGVGDFASVNDFASSNGFASVDGFANVNEFNDVTNFVASGNQHLQSQHDWNVGQLLAGPLEEQFIPTPFGYTPLPDLPNTFAEDSNLQPSITVQQPVPVDFPQSIRQARVACSHLGCNKSYLRVGDCRRHMRVHERLRILCTEVGCGMKFHRRDKLRQHLRQRHHLTI